MDALPTVTGLITEIAEEFSLVGLIEKFVAFFETNSLLTFIVFAVSLFILYRLVKLAFSIFLVVIAGILFPFVMNFLFGASIPITVSTLIFYATFATVLFLLATFLRGIGKFLKALTSPFRKASERKEMENDIEEEIKKDMKEQSKKKSKRKKKK